MTADEERDRANSNFSFQFRRAVRFKPRALLSSRDSPHCNERMHRVRVCDATAVKLHDVTFVRFVVVEARGRDATYSSLVADSDARNPPPPSPLRSFRSFLFFSREGGIAADDSVRAIY